MIMPPIMAASKSTDMVSKGRTHPLKRSSPTPCREPKDSSASLNFRSRESIPLKIKKSIGSIRSSKKPNSFLEILSLGDYGAVYL